MNHNMDLSFLEPIKYYAQCWMVVFIIGFMVILTSPLALLAVFLHVLYGKLGWGPAISNRDCFELAKERLG